MIADLWQGIGLGTALLKSLVKIARRARVGRIIGHIQSDNGGMLHVSRKTGFQLHFRPAEGEWLAEMDLMPKRSERLTTVRHEASGGRVGVASFAFSDSPGGIASRSVLQP